MSESHLPLISMNCRGFETFSQPNQIPSSRFPTSTSPTPDLKKGASAPLSAEVKSLPLTEPALCPRCKGQKYGFTAYFHNTRIFPEPPHELLRLIEKSYFLRDRLKSFLVTYTMRQVDSEQVVGIEDKINKWQQEIIVLMKE